MIAVSMGAWKYAGKSSVPFWAESRMIRSATRRFCSGGARKQTGRTRRRMLTM